MLPSVKQYKHPRLPRTFGAVTRDARLQNGVDEKIPDPRVCGYCAISSRCSSRRLAHKPCREIPRQSNRRVCLIGDARRDRFLITTYERQADR